MRVKNGVRGPADPTRSAPLSAKIVLRFGAGRGLCMRACFRAQCWRELRGWGVPERALACGVCFTCYSSLETWCVHVRTFVGGVRFAFCSMSAKVERVACCPFGCVAARHARGLTPTVCVGYYAFTYSLHLLKVFVSGCTAFKQFTPNLFM